MDVDFAVHDYVHQVSFPCPSPYVTHEVGVADLAQFRRFNSKGRVATVVSAKDRMLRRGRNP